MKTISNLLKTTVTSGLAALLALFAVVPAFAINTPQPKQAAQASICTRITTLSASGRATVSDKRSTLQIDFANRLAGLSTKQAEIDTKVIAARDAATTKFEDKTKSLEVEKGMTATQLTAIEAFKTGVEAAQTTRRAAVDDARAAYQTALATQIATQQQGLSGAVTTYQTAVTGAFATAVTNCTSANAVATLTTLKASIKSARDALNTARTPDANKGAIQTLATTRNSAIKAADATFKTTIQALATTLRAALGITSTTTSSNTGTTSSTASATSTTGN